jgi:2-keto-4-pentenoate hydratase/2-oxohepta-3-ene-1,7-dioic acid hydratase in catechol pathway
MGRDYDVPRKNAIHKNNAQSANYRNLRIKLLDVACVISSRPRYNHMGVLWSAGMKICRFNDDRLGMVQDSFVLDVSDALSALPDFRWPTPPGDALIGHWSSVKELINHIIADAPRLALSDVRLNSPVANPSKIIGIARNRRNLDSESTGPENSFAKGRGDADPIHMFIKATSALVGPAEGVALRFTDRRNDPEAELAIIIGEGGTDIDESDAFNHVFGYSIGLDMSLRGPEPASARKSIDSYAVLGPWITTADEIPDPDNLATRLFVDDAILQDSNTDQLAFGVRRLIAHTSSYFTLYPGDVIMAGTAASFAPIHPGSMMTAKFEGIGRMDVAVRKHG